MAAFQDPETYRDILDGLQLGVSVLDLQKKIVFWSDGAEQISGYSRIEVLGHPCTDNILLHCTETACEMCAEKCPIATTLHDALSVETMSFIHHKSGYRTQVHTWVIPLRDKHGSIIGVIQTFEGESAVHGTDPNNSSMKEHGWLDDVTGLPNQAMMQSHLRETLGTFTELHIPFGIVCLEVQGLREFRAKYGHGAARAILQVLARTLRNTVWPTDVVGTWKENQFLTILMGCSEEALHDISGRVLRMLSSGTIKWWGEELSVAVSLGCAGAVPGDSVDSILQRVYDALSGSQVTQSARAAAVGVNSSSGS
jgi:diguanylate cyclase (GGDEF)-like protein/PAS domain S-box-containing protein